MTRSLEGVSTNEYTGGTTLRDEELEFSSIVLRPERFRRRTGSVALDTALAELSYEDDDDHDSSFRKPSQLAPDTTRE